ncbi:MAG TPA: arsenite methyltransferase [Solirubrobacteraceae bacterium]|nr:arsenite methyltransferase [Solirubrobacteraceae bacterium]
MAELSTPDPPMMSSCCSTEAQATCCEPADKAECCETEAAAAGGCGCAAGETAEPAGASAESDIRETVRAKYAQAARAVSERGSSCCGSIALTDADPTEVFGGSLYEGGDTEGATATAVAASLGCGVPTAVADLHEGETVLDLGSGAGADVLISAQRVGPTGRAIGLDMTDEMLELARANAAEAGVANVEFIKGYIEDIPLADGSVDVIVSNCVLNLSGDKPKVLAEAARVLKPGGRFAVSDVIAGPDMDDATRTDMAAYTGCIAGALTEQEFRDGLAVAGLVDVEIRQTHRVHEHATSAIIRARKPRADTTAARGAVTSSGNRRPA